ncbi:MAG: hypothetical protein HYZ79_09290 [Candidatus Melainabacteria bacterium]|nr:hypothetical protein [Candidatus Melainabacteria bacterium]
MKVDRRAFLTSASTLAAYQLLRSRVPYLDSVAYAAGSKNKTPKTYSISEIFTKASQIDTDKYTAYYAIDTERGERFYIVQKKNCRPDKVFLCTSDNGMNKGLLFPKTDDPTKPVAIVKGEGAGLTGDFEIYDNNGVYEVRFPLTSMIYVPEHSDIDSRVLLNMHNAVKMLPDTLVEKFVQRGIQVYTGRNVEDVYYHLYPSIKKHDQEHPNDPDKPWLEVKEDGSCIDHRNWSNTSAFYSKKMAVIPQIHYEYGTRKLIDRIDDPAWTRKTVGHELGHALADFNSDRYYQLGDAEKYPGTKVGKIEAFDETDAFKMAFEVDLSRMDPDIKEELSYFWCKRKTLGGNVEAFANIFAAFTGTTTKDDAKVMFRGFPNSSEHIRQKVLPLFDVNFSIDYVRKHIYSDYIKDTSRLISFNDKKRFARELSAILNEHNHPNIPIVAEPNPRHVECCGQ